MPAVSHSWSLKKTFLHSTVFRKRSIPIVGKNLNYNLHTCSGNHHLQIHELLSSFRSLSTPQSVLWRQNWFSGLPTMTFSRPRDRLAKTDESQSSIKLNKIILPPFAIYLRENHSCLLICKLDKTTHFYKPLTSVINSITVHKLALHFIQFWQILPHILPPSFLKFTPPHN
jgi:hypothetical protein